MILGACALSAAACGQEQTQTDQFYTLKNKGGMEVVVTNYGGRIVSVKLADKNGVVRDVVLGFDKVEDYYLENNASDFGAAIGRYANRINQGRFTLDGEDLSRSHAGAVGRSESRCVEIEIVVADAVVRGISGKVEV